MLLLDKNINEELYDIIILGGGVAGLAAAITAGQLGLRVLVLEKDVFGGSVAVLESIAQYPGIEEIGGWEFTQTMAKQANDVGARLLDSSEVIAIEESGDNRFKIKSRAGKQFRARSVIITTGGQPRLLELENEAGFAQRGIHTCAQCAGPRYKGQDVAVAGNGSWAVEAALHLLGRGCRVSFITGDAKIFGDASLIKKLLSYKQFHFMSGCHVTKLSGDKYLQEIEVTDLVSGDLEKLGVAAVFVYRSIVPNIKIVSARQNDKGFLFVDENYMTSLPGVFATGRVVHADLPIQVLVGDGSRTALSVAAWLQVKM